MFSDIQVIIPVDTYKRLMAYMETCDIEFSCLIDADYDKTNNAFVLGKVYLLKQEATGATVEIDDDALDKFDFEFIKASKAKTVQLPRCWMHSHVDMKAFFSETDEETIKKRQNNSFNVAIVMNKKQGIYAKAYVATSALGQESHVELENIPVFIAYNDKPSLDRARNEIKDKVKEQKYAVEKYKGGGSPGWKYSDIAKDFPKAAGVAGEKRYYALPEEPSAAIEYIAQHGLKEEWDNDFGEYVYHSEKTGNYYTDEEGLFPNGIKGFYE